MSTMTIAPSAIRTTGRTPARTPGRPAGRPAAAGPVRLTRRGRLVVFLGALLVVLALGVLWGAGSVATERPGTAEPTTIIQVGPGDTLYDIAAGVTVDGDVAAMVEEIQRINALEGGMLSVGQRVRVPVTE